MTAATKTPGVTKRGDRWRAEVMINGERFSDTFPTKDAAITWRHGLKARQQRGAKLARQGATTVAKFWPTFIATRTDPTTADKNRGHYSARIQEAWGHVQLRKITPAALEAWVRDMQLEGLSGNYQASVLYTLSAILTEAVVQGQLDTNPVRLMRKTKRPKTTAKVATLLDDDETERLLAAAPNDHVRALVLIMADTGARIGEAAAVDAGDISEHSLRLHQRVDRATRQIKPGLKNGNAELVVPMTARMAEALVPLLTVQPSGLLFTNGAGNPMDLHNFYKRVWWPMVDRADLGGKRPSPHDMRHTFATAAVQVLPLPDVRDAIGHRDGRSIDRYLHSAREAERVAKLKAWRDGLQADRAAAKREALKSTLGVVQGGGG